MIDLDQTEVRAIPGGHAVRDGDSVMAEAKKRFKWCTEWEGNFRPRFIEDIKFANGDSDNGYQWPNEIRRNRDVDQKPCLTMNLIRQHNKIISNEARKNKSSPKVVGTGNGATEEAASAYRDIIRHIEMISSAQDAYTMARGWQIDGGIGYWRLVTEYSRPDSFDQEIFIRGISDPLSVYLDPDIQRFDGSDSRFGFVFDNVPKEEFDESYPEFKDMLLGQNPMGVGSSDTEWISQRSVRVCEYFRKVKRPDQVVSFVVGGVRKTLLASKMPKNMLDGVLADPLTKTRPTHNERIEWYLIVGEMIVDFTVWVGKYIPLIRVIGEEVVIEGILDRKGHTRSMKDAQRMLNYNAPLALDTPLPTPSGWTTMGEVRAGDWLIDENGKPVVVAGVSPIFTGRKTYKVTFDDGLSIVADEEHLWRVEKRGPRMTAGTVWVDRTVKTSELVPKDHFIHLSKEWDLVEANDFPIHPYVLGLWLGDGTARDARLTDAIEDIEYTRDNIRECGYEVGEVALNPEGTAGTFTIFGIRSELNNLEVVRDKHIPTNYMRASRDQRLAVVQGLMDSDGNINPLNNQCAFVNTNEELINQFAELLRTLNIKPFISKAKGTFKEFPNGRVYKTLDSYRVAFTADPDQQIFRLPRKRFVHEGEREVQWRRMKRFGIKSVVEIGSVPTKCVTLETKNHLFLAGRGMVPTHNSAQVEYVALQGKTPWLAASAAIEEYETMWNSANVVNHSVLVFNAFDDEGNPLPTPTKPPAPVAAPAFQAGMDTAFNQLMMVSGQWQNQMGMQGNERTGKAIDLRQQQSATSTFHFQDNYEVGLRFTATQIIDLAPKVYDTKRVISILAEDGASYDIQIDPGAQQAFSMMQASNGQIVKRIFNPQIGEYAVAPSFGPAYGTKREEGRDSMAMILSQNKELTPVIGDLFLADMDFEGAQEAARRMKRLVPPQALGQGPTQNEQVLHGHVQALTQALQQSLQENAKLDLKLTGRMQLRDIGAAAENTKRLAALKDYLPSEPDALRALVRDAVMDALQDDLSPIIQANSDDLDIDQGASTDAPAGPDALPPDSASEPLMPRGARKAADGHHYIDDPARPGKYLRVEPK